MEECQQSHFAARCRCPLQLLSVFLSLFSSLLSPIPMAKAINAEGEREKKGWIFRKAPHTHTLLHSLTRKEANKQQTRRIPKKRAPVEIRQGDSEAAMGCAEVGGRAGSA